MLNQSTTHCYFGDRDVHAMGTCSATLNDDRGGVCTRGCLNEPLPLPCGCTKLKEPLRRKRLIHEIPHPNTSGTALNMTGKNSSAKKRAVVRPAFDLWFGQHSLNHGHHPLHHGHHPLYHHHADQGPRLVHKKKRNGLELIPARRWWTTTGRRRRTKKIRSRT